MVYLTIGNPPKTILLNFPDLMSEQIENSIFSAIISHESAESHIYYNIDHSDNKLYLQRNGRLTHQNKSSQKIIYALEWQILKDALNSYKKDYKFHAAGLSHRNNGYLFVGDSGSGKTSISMVLMKLGWKLLSDEFGILNPGSLKLYPFPRNFIIKPHHPVDEDFKNRFVNVAYNMDAQKIMISYIPLSIFGKVESHPVKLKSVFFLKYSESSTYCIAPLGQTEAFANLIKQLYNPQLFKRNSLDHLSNLLNNISFFQLLLPNPFNLEPVQKENLSKQLISG